MRQFLRFACVISATISGIFAGEEQQKDYRLVWADEFDKDGRPDPKNWTYESGFVRNEEPQSGISPTIPFVGAVCSSSKAAVNASRIHLTIPPQGTGDEAASMRTTPRPA